MLLYPPNTVLYSPLAGSITNIFLPVPNILVSKLYVAYDLPEPEEPVIKQCDENIFISNSTGVRLSSIPI